MCPYLHMQPRAIKLFRSLFTQIFSCVCRINASIVYVFTKQSPRIHRHELRHSSWNPTKSTELFKMLKALLSSCQKNTRRRFCTFLTELLSAISTWIELCDGRRIRWVTDERKQGQWDELCSDRSDCSHSRLKMKTWNSFYCVNTEHQWTWQHLSSRHVCDVSAVFLNEPHLLNPIGLVNTRHVTTNEI